MTTITKAMAIKVRDTVDAGLVSGVGIAKPGKMCVEAAVCYALGLPHGDDPGCVSPALRRLKMRLNDARWSSSQARAKGLRRLAVAQLGSADVLDEREFSRRVVEMTIRRAVPSGLRAAARINPTHAGALEAAAVRCEREGTREALSAARASAATSGTDAAEAVVAYASDAASAEAATYAAASAAATAVSVAYVAYVAADAADVDAARDASLTTYAEGVVEILIAMKAPGCQWLDLVPNEGA